MLMPKIEVVRKTTGSQYIDVPDGQDPWVLAATYMTNEEVKAVAVHVLPTGTVAPPPRVVGGKTAWKPEPAPRQQREPSMGGAEHFRDE